MILNVKLRINIVEIKKPHNNAGLRKKKYNYEFTLQTFLVPLF